MADDATGTLRIIGLALFLVVSASLVIVGELLARKRIRPNRYIGVRIPATVRNPELWYVVNAFAGKLLIGVGVVTAVIAIGLFFAQRLDTDAYVRVTILAFVALAVGYTVAALIYVRAVSR